MFEYFISCFILHMQSHTADQNKELVKKKKRVSFEIFAISKRTLMSPFPWSVIAQALDKHCAKNANKVIEKCEEEIDQQKQS